jgi:hypothetical protein
MLIKDKPLEHWINNFYGYGSWHAKIWCVAHEEGGGDLPEEVAEKIDYFFEHHNVNDLCDIRELYRRASFQIDGPRADLYRNLFDYRFGPKATLHGSWKNLIAFAHGYRNKKLPDLLKYQKNNFASASDVMALINLYPLPSPHNHAWYYSWLDMPKFSFLKSRAQYQGAVFPKRIKTIIENIGKHKPDLVIMYGMENINNLKEAFHNVKFTLAKAIKLEIPQHHRAEIGGTTLIITTQIPTLRHHRVETGFDWYEFGKLLRK